MEGHCLRNRILFIAFQDKKQTWTLFFSDQNEVTMRIIGLAMHQVLNKLRISSEKSLFLLRNI